MRGIGYLGDPKLGGASRPPRPYLPRVWKTLQSFLGRSKSNYHFLSRINYFATEVLQIPDPSYIGWVFHQMSLDEDHCGECGSDPCECHGPDDAVEEEEEIIESPPWQASQKKRTIIDLEENSDEPKIYAGAAGKAPAHLSQSIDWYGKETDDEPDLLSYLGQFELTKQQEIAICRTYANYLAQQLRASGAMKAPRKQQKK